MKLKPLSKDTLEALKLHEELSKADIIYNKYFQNYVAQQKVIRRKLKMIEAVIPNIELDEYRRQVEK